MSSKWQPLVIGLSAVNLVAVGFAASTGESWHAALHAALALGFGLWAQRMRRDARGNVVADGTDQPSLGHDRIDALERDVAQIRQELGEAQERLDFAERLLARGREPTREIPRT